MTKLNYVAKHNGEIVGTRSSARTYTHAVVIQHNEAWYRERAHSVAYAKQHHSQSNFAYYQRIAASGVEGEMAEYKYTPRADIERRVREAEHIVAMGYDAWVAERLAENIAQHAKNVDNGGFAPAVVTWCGRPDLASKEAAKRQGDPSFAGVWVVEAETVAKLPKIAGERKHAAYGPHSR